MKNLRNERVKLFNIGENNFEMRNRNDDVLLDSNEKYFIYMTAVSFIGNNIIEGRYKGEVEENSPILDNECIDVIRNENGFFADECRVRTARMVAISNKNKVTIIIK